jgi:UDP-N-acetylmuramoyl-tripeptide--D-alanyl-D-alanine ligase
MPIQPLWPAALEVLAASDPQDRLGQGARRIAILGDMLELGREEAQSHAQLAQNKHLLTVDVVHCVGPRMRACYEALPAAIRGRWVPEAQELASGLGELVRSWRQGFGQRLFGQQSFNDC